MPPELVGRVNKASNRFSVGDEDGVGVACKLVRAVRPFEVEEAFEGVVGNRLEDFENSWPNEFSDFVCGPRHTHMTRFDHPAEHAWDVWKKLCFAGFAFEETERVSRVVERFKFGEELVTKRECVFGGSDAHGCPSVSNQVVHDRKVDRGLKILHCFFRGWQSFWNEFFLF